MHFHQADVSGAAHILMVAFLVMAVLGVCMVEIIRLNHLHILVRIFKIEPSRFVVEVDVVVNERLTDYIHGRKTSHHSGRVHVFVLPRK